MMHRCPCSHYNLQERVHVDQTYESAVNRVHQVLGKDKAERLLKSRYQLINV